MAFLSQQALSGLARAAQARGEMKTLRKARFLMQSRRSRSSTMGGVQPRPNMNAPRIASHRPIGGVQPRPNMNAPRTPSRRSGGARSFFTRR